MKANILIVEDETALSDAYETILQSDDYATRIAGDGEEALEILEEFEADLILLDLRMPRVNGLDFLRRFDVNAHPQTKVIVFSNIDSQDEIAKAYELGAERYMLKAWASPNELLSLVSNTLKNNEPRKSKSTKTSK